MIVMMIVVAHVTVTVPSKPMQIVTCGRACSTAAAARVRAICHSTNGRLVLLELLSCLAMPLLRHCTTGASSATSGRSCTCVVTILVLVVGCSDGQLTIGIGGAFAAVGAVVRCMATRRRLVLLVAGVVGTVIVVVVVLVIDEPKVAAP